MPWWPISHVESTPPADFLPPFCPWRLCPAHRPDPSHPFRFHRHGSFSRRCDSRLVPRFLCLSCRRTFSLQSFAFSYYLKRPALSSPIAAGLVAGSAHRQLARSLGCSASTVTLRACRLGRHCLLLSFLALDSLGSVCEPIAYDDFESFVHCQDLAVALGTAVGSASWFVYTLGNAPHLRATRRSPARRLRWPAPTSGSYRLQLSRILNLLLPLLKPSQRLNLLTDSHPAYRRAVSSHPLAFRLNHLAFPNPPRTRRPSLPSHATRARHRALRPTDSLHRLIRHSAAHHRRESIAFARRLEALIERAFLLAAWRNFIKLRREVRPQNGTPAMSLGLSCQPWRWADILCARLFVSKLHLPEPWNHVYFRRLGWPHPHRMRPLQLINAS